MSDEPDEVDDVRMIFDIEYKIAVTHERIRQLRSYPGKETEDERSERLQEIAKLEKNVRSYEAGANWSW